MGFRHALASGSGLFVWGERDGGEGEGGGGTAFPRGAEGGGLGSAHPASH